MRIKIKKSYNRLCYRKILLSTVCFAMLMGKLTADNDKTAAVLTAYSESAYSKAMTLAEDAPNSPEVNLVRALCLIYNNHNQDIAEGVRRLGKLYNDNTISKPTWRVAALSYGRVIQSLRSRPGMYHGIAGNVDLDAVFNQIILEAPDSREACSAMLFLSLNIFTGGDKLKISEIFNRIRKFCDGYKGNPLFLVPLFLFTESKLIEINHDYQSAVEFLEKAYNTKIANSKNEEIVLFRIGRIYDLKLKNQTKAIFYYDLFLRKYPESGFAPSIKRFMVPLKQKENGIQQGTDKDEK